jgi:hypothetical protein
MFNEDLYVYRIPCLSFRFKILLSKHKMSTIIRASEYGRVLCAMRFEIFMEVKIILRLLVYDTV